MKSHQEIRDALYRLEEGRTEILTDACTDLLIAVGASRDAHLEEALYAVLMEHTA